MFAVSNLSADSDQSFISPLGPVTHGTGMGESAPATAYNSVKNEYLIVYSQTDGSCGGERLFGKAINAITGNTVGSVFEISACTNSFNDIQLYYNKDKHEYLVFFKAIGDIGNKSNLYYCSIDGSTNEINSSPTKLIGDAIADPYLDLSLTYDSQIDKYALGYHKNNALSETLLNVNYINGISKISESYETIIDKSNFTSIGLNSGLTSSKLLYNGSTVIGVLELKLDDGHEVWGIFINPSNGEIVGSPFQISPDASTSKFYTNPTACINNQANELYTVYAESYYAEANGQYVLSDTIHVQKSNALTGMKIGPYDKEITPLPGSGNTEDKKLPSVVYSSMSNELILSFYGIRYAAGDDVYNLYLHRVDLSTLISIDASSKLAASGIGTTVLQNGLLKPISFSYNDTNNQFTLAWFDETNHGISSQIWRYDNNKPKDITLSNNSFNEEIPIGTSIATLSASDPDPEDSSPTFTLSSGAGDEDNSFFQVDGSELITSKRLSFEVAENRSIRIRATDSQGESTDQDFNLTVLDIFEKPFGLQLAGTLEIEENSNPEIFSSQISVQDDDNGDTHTYSLVAGDSSDHNGHFEIDLATGLLNLIEPLNYEDTSEQYVRIRATDNTNLYTDKAFAIHVIDINEAPERMEMSPNTIPENDIESSLYISVIDPDKNPNYVITEVDGEGDDDNAYFDISGNELKPIILLDYETKDTYSVRLRAFDGVYDTTQVFQIQVSDVNDPPDSIRINDYRIETDQPGGTLIGALLTYDQDANDSHTYSIESGDNNFFINEDKLYSLNSLVYDYGNQANNIYPIVVQSADQQGAITQETINIEVVLVKDDENPVIRDFEKNPLYVDENESVLNLSISATDNIEIDTVLFYFRSIRSIMAFKQPDNVDIDIQHGTFYVNVPLSTDYLDEVGIEYYFKAFDTSGNVDSSSIGYTYWSYNNKNFEAVNKSYDGTVESYKIISNPYLLESNQASKVFANYGPSTEDSWRLFNFSNGKNKEIGTNTSSNIERGKGYWFNKSDALSLQIFFDRARTHQDNKSEPYKLNLVKGWNLIGNPYPFELNWEHILSNNGLSVADYELFTFNKTYAKASTLHEFEGGFVFTESAITVDVPIDDQLFPGGRIANSKESGEGWMVNLSLENKTFKNELSAFGMHSMASESYDSYDSPLPPKFIEYLDIAFNHPEHLSNAFSQDVVDIQENHIWEFVASTNMKERQVTLTWDASFADHHEKQLIFYDLIHDKVISASSSSSYKFTLDQPTPFKIIYGDQSFIENSLSNIKIEVPQPYPNPFNHHVEIPVKLPHSQDPYHIEYYVYNLMGEKIFEEKIYDQAPGIMKIVWDEDITRKLEHGIYIYSIKVTNGFLTNKFHGRIVKN